MALTHPASLAALTDPEVAERLQGDAPVLLACGSIEQHGPHLPTGADTYIAESLAVRVAERLHGVVVPMTPVGITPLHMGFAGTLTLSQNTFMAMVREVALSAFSHGARFLAAVNWHEFNIPALALALDAAQREAQRQFDAGCRCVAVQACFVAADLLQEEWGPLTHGGSIETLCVLADHPELVHLDRIEAIPEAPRGPRLDVLRRDRNFQPVITDVREMSPEGWHGDPRRATRAAGLAAIERIADAIAAQLADMRDYLRS